MTTGIPDKVRPVAGLPAAHVVAGVITDARGRILLTRRTEGRELAGLWEFPGGKVEPGETPQEALVRELREELGIEAVIGEPLIAVPQITPKRRLCLDVYRVASWKGPARGREGQALSWVDPSRLSRYPMPPPDRPVVAALTRPDHCLVTPQPDGDACAWLAALDAALEGGVRRMQFRARLPDPDHRRALLAQVAARCREHGAELLVNGDAALAREFGTGLHLPSAQLRGLRARPVEQGVPLSASCHDAGELRMAEDLGCDFALLGPVRATPSHPGRPGIGWERFAELREQVSLPVYALGGLGPADLGEARRHGAQGIAAIRGLWPGAR